MSVSYMCTLARRGRCRGSLIRPETLILCVGLCPILSVAQPKENCRQAKTLEIYLPNPLLRPLTLRSVALPTMTLQLTY